MRAPGAVVRLHASYTSLSGVGTGETANVPAAISVARADSSSTNVAIGIDPWPLPTMSTRAARSQAECSSIVGPAIAPICSHVSGCAGSSRWLRTAGSARCVGLSLTQLRLLGILRDREPGMLELAGYLKLEKSSVSGLVDRAEQRGLVRRRPGPGDGRTVHVTITRRGRAIAEQIEHDLAQPLAGLLRPLPKRQRVQLVGLLRTLLDSRG